MIQKLRSLSSSIYIKIFIGFTAILLLSLFLGYGTYGELKTVNTVVEAMAPRIENIQTFAEMRATLNILASHLTKESEHVSAEEITVLTRRLEEDLALVLERPPFGDGAGAF